MKKLIKNGILIVICFWTICQVNSSVYAYTISEVKNIVGFTITEEAPEEYDIEIDAEDMISNEKLPAIETSIEDVLYGEDELLDINFLTTDTSNTNDSWLFIQEGVQSAFTATTYIAAATMLTLVIVVAIMILMDSFSVEANTPERSLKNKIFIQQWFISVAILTLMAFVINFIVYFSNNITDMVSDYELEEDNIIIYVTNSDPKGKSNATSSSSTSDLLFWPTDYGTISSHFGSRSAPTAGASTNHKGIDIAVTTGTNVYAAAAGTVTTAGYSDSAGNWVVIDHGNGYVTKYMHNSELKVSEGDTVTKGQLIALAGSTGISTGSHLHFQIEEDGTAVDPEEFAYDNAPLGIGGSKIMSDKATTSSSEDPVNYYFSTNVEGLLMFQSQYNWEEYAVKNMLHILSGIALTAFKIGLYFVFIIRTGIIAILVIAAPIVALVNAFIKINGGQGIILTNWIKLFLYFALLKTVIALLYYVLVSSKVSLIIEAPLYILLPIVAITYLFVKSLSMLMKGFKSKQKNKPLKKKGFSMI